MSALSPDQREALVRHGYDPDLRPRGVSGGPERFRTYAKEPGPGGGWEGWPYLRNHVCKLDGIVIDGHEFSDLDAVGPGSACIQCGAEFEEVIADEWGDDE